MSRKNLKVLLIIEQCNPAWASVPLEGYSFYESISQRVDTTLVTHERNRPVLEKVHPNREIIYIPESQLIQQYYAIASRFSRIKNTTIWPLHHTLLYPVYAAFNRRVYTTVKKSILRGDYDIVHAITPMMPRYPVKAVKVCQKTPFIIGPVNGGVPFPKGFQTVARQEFSNFNFLRTVGRWLIPGYRETYEKAAYIFAGSTYTLGLIKDLFDLPEDRVELFYENGIKDSFLQTQRKVSDLKAENQANINLLFVGRLVPYKGADMVIEAISQLKPSIQEKVSLTIVGDGSERSALEHQVNQLQLREKIDFTGWVNQQETLNYYSQADIFCFPSIREFGGAVVLEAMASGLPCIVVNNGGIGEYVTEETGFKIEPRSREFVVQELVKCIEQFVQDSRLRQQMSLKAIQNAKNFTWSVKAERIVDVYHKLLSNDVGKTKTPKTAPQKL